MFKPLLTNHQKYLISRALEQSNFNPYRGEFDKVSVDDKISIWYEEIGSKNDPPVLLLMGHSFTALGWPDYFIDALINQNLRIIRMDNRGIGLSSRVRDWNSSNPYTTRDMAKDAMFILDHLKIKSAHVLGVSMGGMIAQDLAIDYPERVTSLCLAMTTGKLFDSSLSKPSKSLVWKLMRLMKKYKGSMNKSTAPYMYISLINIISKNYIDEEIEYFARACSFEYSNRLPWSFKYARQHNQAMLKRGDRWEEISEIAKPTLIFHGKKDPIFHLDHALKLNSIINGSELSTIDSMGHFLRKTDNAYVAESYAQYVKTYI